MTSAERKEPGGGLSQEAIQEMEKYGVKRVTADIFFVGSYRYTNLDDAIAQAKRQQHSGGKSWPS